MPTPVETEPGGAARRSPRRLKPAACVPGYIDVSVSVLLCFFFFFFSLFPRQAPPPPPPPPPSSDRGAAPNELIFLPRESLTEFNGLFIPRPLGSGQSSSSSSGGGGGKPQVEDAQRDVDAAAPQKKNKQQQARRL